MVIASNCPFCIAVIKSNSKQVEAKKMRALKKLDNLIYIFCLFLCITQSTFVEIVLIHVECARKETNQTSV